jgi:hypothetical protein
MGISWYSISIALSNGTVVFNGFFSVDTTTNIVQSFYYVNNYQYVDILVRVLGNNGSNNEFLDNNFTGGGTNIKPVIPYMNVNFNNPYELNLWRNGSVYTISYNPTSNYLAPDWPYSSMEFAFTFTSISGLPALSVPRYFFSMGSLFSNNAQVYYKPHSLSSGGGGVRNSRIIRRKT